jgi:hypothetical protein
LTVTNRIEGRCAASQIASASAASFFWRLTNGDQPHLVPQPGNLPAPVMRRAASLHRHHARLQRSEEPQHLTAPQLLAHHRMPGRIGTVHLKNQLGQIQTNRANLIHGRLLFGNSKIPTLAHQGREGASTPSTEWPTPS